jgi:uncharacterized protein
MKILLSDITEDGLDLVFEDTFDSGPFKPLSPVKASLHVDKFSSEVLIAGEVKAFLELQCSRCLKLFPRDTEIEVNAVYHPLDDLKGEERHEVKDDELDMGFYSGDELDIQELVKEQIILSIPIKPLCSESCRGICPICGTDLNADTCSCREKSTDPRLAVLKKLLDDRKE